MKGWDQLISGPLLPILSCDIDKSSSLFTHDYSYEWICFRKRKGGEVEPNEGNKIKDLRKQKIGAGDLEWDDYIDGIWGLILLADNVVKELLAINLISPSPNY